jgi:hypothetical protein
MPIEGALCCVPAPDLKCTAPGSNGGCFMLPKSCGARRHDVRRQGVLRIRSGPAVRRRRRGVTLQDTARELHCDRSARVRLRRRGLPERLQGERRWCGRQHDRPVPANVAPGTAP